MQEEKMFYKEDKGEYTDYSTGLQEHPVAYVVECYECQRRHYKIKGFDDGKFPIVCREIPIKIIEKGYEGKSDKK